MHSEDESHRLAEIIIDATAEPYGLDDRAEIIVEKYNRGCLARHVRSASAHGNTDVRRLKRGRIVDTVPGHSHDFAIRLERVDDTELLLRHDPSKHRRGAHAESQFGVAQLLELFTCCAIFGVEAGLARDCFCRRWMVASDHDHFDA